MLLLPENKTSLCSPVLSRKGKGNNKENKIKTNYWKAGRLIYIYHYVFCKILIMEKFPVKLLDQARWTSFVHFWSEFSRFIHMNLWKKLPEQATGKVPSKWITMWNSDDNLGRYPISQKTLVKLKLRLNRHSTNLIGKRFRRALLLRLYENYSPPPPKPNPLNLESAGTHN